MADTFTCAHCGGTFEKGWSDEEAKAEEVEVWGGEVEDPTLVCDECFQIVRPDRVPTGADIRETWERARAAWQQHTGRNLPEPRP
jgi:NAD-dependent SIR2 family protein deacetylase